MTIRAGIDVGSTTVKLVIIDEENHTKFAKYERHYSDAVSYTHLDVYKRQGIKLKVF
nr:hypothetical protein A5881_003587 [Enterococcus termitis]